MAAPDRELPSGADLNIMNPEKMIRMSLQTPHSWPVVFLEDEVIITPVRIVGEGGVLSEIVCNLQPERHERTNFRPNAFVKNLRIPSRLLSEKIYIMGKVATTPTPLLAGAVQIHEDGGLMLATCRDCDAYFEYRKPYLVCDKCHTQIRDMKISPHYGKNLQI